jgi:hypothetical protein
MRCPVLDLLLSAFSSVDPALLDMLLTMGCSSGLVLLAVPVILDLLGGGV